MFLKSILFFFLLSGSLFASLDFAPKSFYSYNLKKMVFIDISFGHYSLLFDKDKVYVKTKLYFETKEKGYPLFDLVSDSVSMASINNSLVDIGLAELPNKDSDPMRFIKKEIPAGKHELEIYHVLANKNDSFIFEFCDGKGVRQLLERYLPSNLQYDQYKINFKLDLSSKGNNYEVISNGNIVSKENVFFIDFPKFYNSASVFLHVFLKTKHFVKREKYKGVKITLYTSKINSHLSVNFLMELIKNKMNALEKLYGKWPYDFFIVYLGENFSGIEHAGATRTSLYSLGHEMFHMYFGRGVMPLNGKSGWIDEGLARWADGGSFWKIGRKHPYMQYKELPSSFKGLSFRSEYMRKTFNSSKDEEDPYYEGAIFFGHLDYKMKGEFREFLKYFVQKFKHRLYTEKFFFEQLAIYLENHDYDFSCDDLYELLNTYFKIY